MAREKLCLGVDIGSSSVKVCLLRRQKGQLRLEAFGQAPLPAETVVDGALMNSARVVEVLQELVAAHHIKQRQAAMSVSGHSVIIKKIPLPQMSRGELEESIQWEAEQFIPFDINDVHLDVQIVNESSAQAGQMDVVLVAAKKDFVNEYTSVLAEAGLDPVICDVDAFAIETMFESNYEIAPNQTVVLVNVGASKANINIVHHGVSSFTRDLNVGGNNFTEEIQKQLGVSFEEAEALKIGGREGSRDAVVPHEVQRAIQLVAENITTEVQRSVDFYQATSADPPPAQVLLTGGSAKLQALGRALQQRMGVPVSAADPFRKIDLAGQDKVYLDGVGPTAAVSVGLALRFPGDC